MFNMVCARRVSSSYYRLPFTPSNNAAVLPVVTKEPAIISPGYRVFILRGSAVVLFIFNRWLNTHVLMLSITYGNQNISTDPAKNQMNDCASDTAKF